MGLLGLVRRGLLAGTLAFGSLAVTSCNGPSGSSNGPPPSGLEAVIDGPSLRVYPDSLSGVFSAEPVGEGYSYSWSASPAAGGASVPVIDDDSSAAPTITFPMVGEYVVEVEVSKGSRGGVASLDVEVRTPRVGDVTADEARSMADAYSSTRPWLSGVDITPLFMNGSIGPIRSENRADDPRLGFESYDEWFLDVFSKHMVEERGMPADSLQSYVDRFARDARFGYDEFVATVRNNRNVEDGKDEGRVDPDVFLNAWDIGFLSGRVFEDGWNPPYGGEPGAFVWSFYNQGDRFSIDGARSWMNNVGFDECPIVEIGKDLVSHDFVVSPWYAEEVGRPAMVNQFYLTKVFVNRRTVEPVFEVDGEERFQYGLRYVPFWSPDVTGGSFHWTSTAHMEPPVGSNEPLYDEGVVLPPFSDDDPSGFSGLHGYLEEPVEVGMVSRGRANLQIDWNYRVKADDPNELGLERTVMWPVFSKTPDATEFRMTDPVDPTLPLDERLMFEAGPLRLPVSVSDGVVTWDISGFNPCNYRVLRDGSLFRPIDAPYTYDMDEGSNTLR